MPLFGNLLGGTQLPEDPREREALSVETNVQRLAMCTNYKRSLQDLTADLTAWSAISGRVNQKVSAAVTYAEAMAQNKVLPPVPNMMDTLSSKSSAAFTTVKGFMATKKSAEAPAAAPPPPPPEVSGGGAGGSSDPQSAWFKHDVIDPVEDWIAEYRNVKKDHAECLKVLESLATMLQKIKKLQSDSSPAGVKKLAEVKGQEPETRKRFEHLRQVVASRLDGLFNRQPLLTCKAVNSLAIMKEVAAGYRSNFHHPPPAEFQAMQGMAGMSVAPQGPPTTLSYGAAPAPAAYGAPVPVHGSAPAAPQAYGAAPPPPPPPGPTTYGEGSLPPPPPPQFYPAPPA